MLYEVVVTGHGKCASAKAGYALMRYNFIVDAPTEAQAIVIVSQSPDCIEHARMESIEAREVEGKYILVYDERLDSDEKPAPAKTEGA